MSVLKTRAVTLELVGGVPAVLEWAGIRYLVTDHPTELADLLYGITHPPALIGWRFQGTGPNGETHVFDVVQTRIGWELARTFD